MPYHNRDPKRDHNFDIHPYRLINKLQVWGLYRVVYRGYIGVYLQFLETSQLVARAKGVNILGALVFEGECRGEHRLLNNSKAGPFLLEQQWGWRSLHSQHVRVTADQFNLQNQNSNREVFLRFGIWRRFLLRPLLDFHPSRVQGTARIVDNSWPAITLRIMAHVRTLFSLLAGHLRALSAGVRFFGKSHDSALKRPLLANPFCVHALSTSFS